MVTVTIPQVNIDSGTEMGAGVAAPTTARTSIGGLGLVSGPLQLFELRPLTVTASIAENSMARFGNTTCSRSQPCPWTPLTHRYIARIEVSAGG